MARLNNAQDPWQSFSEARRARAEWEDEVRHFSTLHDRGKQDLQFALEMEHYISDDKRTLDLRRIKPKDETQYRRIRYVAASILSDPLYFEGLPTDHTHTPDQVEQARNVVEALYTNPSLRFESCLSRSVYGSLSAGMWFLGQDFVPDIGDAGAIVHRALPMDALTWTPGFPDFHDPLCPALSERCYMPLSQAMSMPKWDSADLMPDKGVIGSAYKIDALLPGGQVLLPSGQAQNQMGPTDQPYITIIKRWYKRDQTKKFKPAGDTRKLDDAENYMACPTCGYQSLPQREVTQEMPDFEPSGCPQCHGDIYRIHTEVRPPSTLAYPRGHKLVIIAPFSPGYEDRPVWSGAWPYTREGYNLRSFPYAKIYFGEHPTKPCGQSEASLSKSQQLIIDATLRSGYEQMSTSRSVLKLPRMGLEAYNGEPFMYTDAQGQVAFYTTDFPPGGMEWIQGPGLNENLAQFYQIMSGSMRGNEGTSEIGMEGGKLNNAPSGTAIKQIVTQGNIPVDDKKRMLWREISVYAGVTLDLWRATTHTPQPIRSKSPNGEVQVQNLSGFDVIPADIVLTATPSFNGMEQERMQAWQSLQQMPPHLRPSYAQAMNIGPSLLRALAKDEANAPKQTGPSPEQIAAMLGDVAQIAKAAPGSVAENQIQWFLTTFGCPPPQGPTVQQAITGQSGAPATGMPPGAAESPNGAPNGVPPAVQARMAQMGPA